MISRKRIHKQLYIARPILVWKLERTDSERIFCGGKYLGDACGKRALYGWTVDGGPPYFYACASHVPTGARLCSNTAALIAAAGEVKGEK